MKTLEGYELELIDAWALGAPAIPNWFRPLPAIPPLPTGFCAACSEPNQSAQGLIVPGGAIQLREGCPDGDEDCSRTRMQAAEMVGMVFQQRDALQRLRQVEWPYAWARMQMAERAKAVSE